jgi:hypothetical protein
MPLRARSINRRYAWCRKLKELIGGQGFACNTAFIKNNVRTNEIANISKGICAVLVGAI